MNFFDASIMRCLNGLSQTSRSFDSLMIFIVDNSFVKGVIIVSLLWFFWFQESSKITFNRERVIICIVSCFISLFVARALALTLPFRLRPFFNSGINFIKPLGARAPELSIWSSFPSDNAVMFFSLATGIFLISRRVGLLTYLYVLAVICFPRVYLGYHYPTDILAGAILGISITYLISIEKVSRPVIQKVFRFSNKYTGLFYTLCFLLIYEISRMFIEVRWAGTTLLHLLHIHV